LKIGLISDTHDNLPKIKSAVSFFQKNRVNLILHAGDFVAPFAVREFTSCGIEFKGVFGNNDGEKIEILKMAQGRIFFPPLSLDLNGFSVFITHNIDLIKGVNLQSYNLVLYGHTHKSYIKEHNGSFIVNPGEGCGVLSGEATVGLLDLKREKLDIVKI